MKSVRCLRPVAGLRQEKPVTAVWFTSGPRYNACSTQTRRLVNTSLTTGSTSNSVRRRRRCPILLDDSWLHYRQMTRGFSSTEVSPPTTKKDQFTELLEKSSPSEAQDVFDKTYECEWKNECRYKLFDAWIDYQQRLLDDFNNSLSSSQQQQISHGQKLQLHEICQAATHAHDLLEQMEPFLGARNIWLEDDSAALNEDGTDNAYHGKLIEGTNISKKKDTGESEFDEIMTARCDSVLTAWARAVRAGYRAQAQIPRAIPQRAQFLLQRMEASVENDSCKVTVKPSLNSYNRVLEAWAYSKEHLRGASAERIFAKMQSSPKLQPNGESHRLIVWAWALSREGRAAFNTTGHLMKMLRKLESEVGSDNDVYVHPDSSMEPTLEDYRIVLKAWTRSEEKASPGKAQSILRIMESKFKTGVSMVRPDEICYRYVLETAAHRPLLPHLGGLVDDTLRAMRENFMFPDSKCFSAAIRTWKNAAVHQPDASASSRQTCIRRAMELLAEMEVAHNQSKMVAVVVSTKNVNDVLEVLTLSTDHRRMEQAEKLLGKMEKALSNGEANLSPNAESYIQTLRVLSTIDSIEKIARGKVILWRMIDNFGAISSQYEKKDALVDVFNEFVHVCFSHRARSGEEGLQVLREALSSIETMRGLDGLEPNAATYAALLEACANLFSVGKEKQALVGKIFSLCCDDGMVDDKVLRHLRTATTTEQYSTMVVALSEDVEGIKVVPEEWTKKALGGKVISVDGRKTTPLSIDGRLATTLAMQEFKMRRIRDKRNRNLLCGGRLRPPKDAERPTPFRLYDPSSVKLT